MEKHYFNLLSPIFANTRQDAKRGKGIISGFLILFFLMGWSVSWGQVSLTNVANTAAINFSATVSGVSNGAYTGAGFQAVPTSGQLDSDAWEVTGWSDGALAFGGTRITAATDYTRGASAIATSTGGFFSYTGLPGSVSNPAFMIQPGGSDFAPGTLTLRILNNGTNNLTELAISYNIFVRNDQTRSNSFNFSHSIDNSLYTSVNALNYTSTAASDALGWVVVGTAPSRSTTITGLNVVPGGSIYIRWSGADAGGTGSRDEFGLDDISLTGTFAAACTPQTITALSTPVTKSFGDTHSVFTTSTSGLAVTYGLSNGSVASIASNGAVTILGVGGPITITASQAGNGTFCAATPVAQSFTVIKAISTITTAPTAAGITYGQPLSAATLSGGVGSPAGGDFAFTAPSTIPNAGTAGYSVTYTVDPTNYNTFTVNVNVTVAKANSSITATGATTYTYTGLPQGPNTSTVAGSIGLVAYSYSGVSPTVYGATATIPAGAGTYQVVATVAEDANHNGASSAPLAFAISKAVLTVTADDETAVENTVLPTFTVTYAGFQNSEAAANLTPAPSASSPTGNIATPGSYPIVAAGGGSDNYSFTYLDGNFLVTSASAPVCAIDTDVAPTADQTRCQGVPAATLTATITSAGSTGTPSYTYQWFFNTTNSNNPTGATTVGTNSNTFVPPTTGSEGTRYYFSVGYSDNSECGPQTVATPGLASVTVLVTVNPTPSTPIVSNNGPVCQGTSLTLSTPTVTGGSYAWTGPNGFTSSAQNPQVSAMAAINLSGNYFVTVTVNGCASDSSLATNAIVNPTPVTPTISITAGATPLCPTNGNVTLTSSTTTGSYLWSNSLGNTQSIIVSTAGSYSVLVTENGCTSALSAAFVISTNPALVVGAVSTLSVPDTSNDNVVISQVYGGGGNTAATFRNDFVELYNPTASSVSLAGWSLQQASSTGTTWTVTTLTGAIAAGGYYLVQGASGGAIGASLPTANATGTFNMGVGSGKIALSSSTTAYTTACPSANIIDFIGFGSGTNCSETAIAQGLTGNILSYQRKNAGCTETDNNANDFTNNTTAFARNSASPTNTCTSNISTQTICSGATPSSMSVTAASGSTGSFTYQWYSIVGITTTISTPATSSWTALGTGTSFTPSAITQSTTYACFVTPTGCNGAWATSERQVTVQAAPASAGSNGLLAICGNTTPTNEELFASLTGTPALGGTWSGPVSGVYTYTQTVTSPCAINNTATVTVTNQALPNAGTNGTLTVCAGTTTAPVALTGSVGATFNITGGAAIGLANQTGVAAIPSFTAIAGTATLTITPTFGTCTGTAISYAVIINALPTTVSVSPATQAICTSDASAILLTGSGGLIPAVAYCTPTVTSSDGSDFINNFSCGGIVNNGSGQSAAQYGNFTNLTATVVAGVATLLSVQSGGSSAQNFGVWLDLDQNGIFGANEFAALTTVGTTAVVSTNLTIPTTAFNGTTRMRVAARWNTVVESTISCANPGFGEFEDYTVVITGGTNAPVATYVWTSTSGGLFTDAAATTAYTGAPSATVYAKPTANATITATFANAAGCIAEGAAVITVTTATAWYADTDGDTFGAGTAVLACIQPTGFVANNTDCNNTDPLLTNNCNTVVNLKAFIQGYYNGTGMVAARYDNLTVAGSPAGNATDVDEVTVELRGGTTPGTIAYTVTGMLQTDGTMSVIFPAGAVGNSYYIVLKHRSSLQLWSATPIAITSLTTYDFSTGLGQAYTDGSFDSMALLAPGVYGLYTGDINQDDFIDASDFPLFETDIDNSAVNGLYLLSSDLNGDTFVDASDFPIFDANTFQGFFAQFPTP